jgi:hypothetical protein
MVVNRSERNHGAMKVDNFLTLCTHTGTVEVMETNLDQIPPSQQKRIGALGKVSAASQVDDLCWELEHLCKSLNLSFTRLDEVEITTTNNQTFNANVIDKFKCETQSFTEHILLVSSESNSGNYSAPRFMKNLRNAIKMLKSGDELLTVCDTKNCDYCAEGGK